MECVYPRGFNKNAGHLIIRTDLINPYDEFPSLDELISIDAQIGDPINTLTDAIGPEIIPDFNHSSN